MSPQLKGILITLLGVLIIVPDSLMIRLIDAHEMTIVFWRSGISLLVMGGYCLFVSGFVRMGPAALLFAISEAAGSILFIVALENTSVASTLFLVSTSPIFSALISRIVLGERLSRRMLITIILALVGIAVIASGSAGSDPSRLVGDLAAIGVALSLGIAFTTVRHSPDVPVVQGLALAYLCAAVFSFTFAPNLQLHGAEWVWITLNGALFVPVGFALLAMGPRYITSAEVSLILLLEAVLAPLLVWSVLGENPGNCVILGGAIVLAVLLVSNLIGLSRNKRRARQP